MLESQQELSHSSPRHHHKHAPAPHTNINYHAILNSITEEPVDSILKHSQHQEDS